MKVTVGTKARDTYLPVLALVDSVGVGLGKLGLRVEGCDGCGELGHRVKVGREVVQHGDDVARKRGAVGPFF